MLQLNRHKEMVVLVDHPLLLELMHHNLVLVSKVFLLMWIMLVDQELITNNGLLLILMDLLWIL